MRSRLIQALLLLVLLAGLPLLGVWAAGLPVARYLEFPPRTVYVEPPPFSWPVFVVVAALIAAFLLPFVVRVVRGRRLAAGGWRSEGREGGALRRRRFPWWGWAGVAFGAFAWFLAWTRQPWFAPWQRHTFAPLWLAYIVVANALLVRRTGRCPMLAAPRRFLALFPLSAGFWWFFEYLNRFVQNWHYRGIGDMRGAEYVLYATLPFATVLPAVLSTERLLATVPRLTAGLADFPPIRLPRRALAVSLLAPAAVGLALVGVWPAVLFPLLWVAPLLVLLGLEELAGRPHVLEPLLAGDARRAARWALAALVCGFFWEMWNFHSLAQWVYAVPYVGRFHLFEMPILGYAGYLPFGLECAAILDTFAASPCPTREGRA